MTLFLPKTFSFIYEFEQFLSARRTWWGYLTILCVFVTYKFRLFETELLLLFLTLNAFRNYFLILFLYFFINFDWFFRRRFNNASLNSLLDFSTNLNVIMMHILNLLHICKTWVTKIMRLLLSSRLISTNYILSFLILNNFLSWFSHVSIRVIIWYCWCLSILSITILTLGAYIFFWKVLSLNDISYRYCLCCLLKLTLLIDLSF